MLAIFIDMCWITRKKENAIGRIAEKDINVYKIMYEVKCNLYSWYNNFPYEVNTTYIWNKKLKISRFFDCWTIEKGFHSYSNESTIISKENNRAFGESFVVRSHNNNELCDSYFVSTGYCLRNIKKVECIIPKGAIYYENEGGEIVSNQIKITNLYSF